MADEIKLIDIRFDASKASSSLEDLTKLSAKLAIEQKKLKDSTKELTAEQTKLDKSLADGATTQEEYEKETLRIAEAQAKARVATTELNQKVSENNASIKSNITILNSQQASVKQMRARLSEVSKAWANLTEDEINNTEAGRKLNNEKKLLTDNLKRLEGQTGDTRRNVGNYTESIIQAAKSTQLAQTATKGMSNGLIASLPAIGGFNAMLSANPVGVVVMAVTALISVIDNLVTGSEEASQSVGRAFSGISAILKNLSRVALKPIIAVAEGIGFIVDKAMDAAVYLGVMSNETRDLADAGRELAKSQKETYELETQRLPQIKKLQIEIERLKNIEGDATKTDQERLAAGKEVLSLLSQQEAMSVDLAKRKFEEAKANAALADATAEERRAVAEAETELYDIQQDYVSKRAEMITATSGYIKDMQDQRTEYAAKAAEDRAAIEEAEQKRIAEAAEEAYNNRITNYDNQTRALEIAFEREKVLREVSAADELAQIDRLNAIKSDKLAEQLENNKITLEDYNLSLEEMELERLNKESEIRKEAEARERERKSADAQLAHELKLMETANTFEQQRINLELEREQAIAAAEQSGQDVSLVKKKYAKLGNDINKAEYQANLAMAGDLAGQLSSLLGEETVAGKIAAVAQATINTYLGATKALAQGGILGVAQAAIVIASGLAQVAKISATKTEVPKTEKPTAKYAQGGSIKFGTFGGRSHAQGGTQLVGSDGTRVEVEKGENFYILNRKASAAINGLSAINQSYGGASFATTTPTAMYANGGSVKLSGGSQGMSQTDMQAIANLVIAGVSAQPAPVVSIVDIDTRLSDYNGIKNIVIA